MTRMNSDELIILLAKRYKNEYNKPKIHYERIEREMKKKGKSTLFLILRL